MNNFDAQPDEYEEFRALCQGYTHAICRHRNDLEMGQRSAIYCLLSGKNSERDTGQLIKIIIRAHLFASHLRVSGEAWKEPHPEFVAFTAAARALDDPAVRGAWRARTFHSGMREIIKSLLFLRELFEQLHRIATKSGYVNTSECYMALKLFNVRND